MTPRYRVGLPQLTDAGHQTGVTFLTDSGIETDLIHHHGLDLREFATFPLLDDAHGRSVLAGYFVAHAQLAGRSGAGFILDTVTWRASERWGTMLGYDDEALESLNRRAVDFIVELRAELAPTVEPVVLNGVIGPRYDGHEAADAMTPEEAQRYHSAQIDVLADTDLDQLTALTVSNVPEAIGMAMAARDAGIPLVLSFTVETDGRLPDGAGLGDAIVEVDAATAGFPAYFMVNCAHPEHFRHVLDPAAKWIHRVRGIRVNASTRSHEELDSATDLDEGDPVALGRAVADLARLLPDLVVVGGCCGSDLRHVAEIAAALR